MDGGVFGDNWLYLGLCGWVPSEIAMLNEEERYMRNVVYADYSDSGYACAICKEPIKPEEIFNDRWHCGHSAYVEDAAPTCKTTGLPCCRCQPVCEHRRLRYE